MTEEHSSLLDQLRINRAPAPKRRGTKLSWIALPLLLLAAAGGGYWWWQQNETGVPVKIVLARAIAGSEQSAAGASILDASGYIVAHRQATVASLQEIGLVAAVPVEEGDHVLAGQILAQLDDRDLKAQRGVALAGIAQNQAALAQAQAALADAAPIFQRDRTEAARGLISAEAFDTERSSYDNARTAVAMQQAALANSQANLAVIDTSISESTIRAPFAGVITAVNAQVGEIVSPAGNGGFTQTGIATLVDMSSLEAQVDVSETFINRVEQSQKVTIVLNAYPDWQIPGRVTAVIPTADKTTATVTVRVALGVKDQRILPNMGVHVSFLEATPTSGPAPQGTMVERDAVQESDNASGTVFVVSGDQVQARKVTLGARDGNDQTILSGLAPGESVAVGDLTQLSDGKKIRVIQ